MDKLTLEVQARDKSIKAKDLLAKDLIPAIFYGKGIENMEFQMNYQAFRKAYKQAGSNTIIELKTEDGKTFNVLASSVQLNPVTDMIVHVDFINVRMDEEIQTEVPLKFVGTSLAVKNDSGTLTSNVDALKVKCLPKDLVHEIEVSIEPLVDFNAIIRVKDLTIPQGITVLTPEDELVATVVPPREEKEEAPVVAEGAAAPVEGATPAEGEKK
ncbi:MAG: 50S ribosomal protein L25 [Candidatus Gracilibacteria bacterium]|nr:50S ribosomal protein L25 [Candidatus Gracilibacteria bacterium]